MRHRTFACVGAAVLGLALLWPAPADAQHRRGGRTVVRVPPATRAVRVARPVYSRGIYYSRYYSPFYSFYWGWGYPWYPYPYFYGSYADPYWYGGPWYGPWYGARYYDNYSSVRVQATPRDARVYVDGYYVGLVDDFDGTFQRLRLPPGGHEITLHLNGYRNAVEKLYLQPHTTYRVRTTLEPLPSGAPQDPEPLPNPDAVRSMDPERGASPQAPEPPGPPSERWPPRQQAEQQQQVRRQSGFGTLTVRVQPSDAEVIVDDTPWRGGADENGAISIQIPAGSHQIDVRREGYASFITTVEVRPGVSTPLNVMLQREK